MEGGEGEMIGVGGSLDGHDFVPVIGFDDFGDFIRVGQERKCSDEIDTAGAFRFGGAFEFLQDDAGSDTLIVGRLLRPRPNSEAPQPTT